MNDTIFQQSVVLPTINEFDMYSAASREDLPRYVAVIDIIDKIVDTAFEDRSLSDRAPLLGKNLLDMVDVANKQARN